MWAARTAALLTFAIGTLNTIAHVAEFSPATRTISPFALMPLGLAVGIALAGVSLLILVIPHPGPKCRAISGLFAVSAMAIGVLEIAHALFGAADGLDRWLAATFPIPARNGAFRHMSPLAALCLAVGGNALLMVPARTSGVVVAGQTFATVVALVAEAGLIGNAYSLTVLYAIPAHSDFALAPALLLLALGILAARPRRGLVGTVLSPTIGGRIWRRLLPAAILIPTALAGLKLLGYRFDWFDHGEGTALAVMGTTVAFLTVIAWVAATVFRFESQQHHWLSTVFASIGDAVISTDTKGRVRFLNKLAATLIGMPEREAIGKPLGEVFRVVDGRTGRPIADPVALTRRLEAVVDVEKMPRPALVVPDGRQIPLALKSAPIRVPIENEGGDGGETAGMIFVFRDISERVASRQALEISERNLRHLADSMPQIVWSATADGHMEFFNRRGFEYTGIPISEPVAFGDTESWDTAIHPDDHAHVAEVWQQSRESHAPVELEYRMRRSDGEYRWFLTRAVPMLDDAGNIAKWFGTSTDIHDQKMAQQQLRELTQTLDQRVTERTAQLQAMAMEVTHAEQRERRHLAQILHDHLQQVLVAVKYRVGKLRMHAPSEGLRALAAEAEVLLGDSLATTRSLAVQLSPPILYEGGFEAALQWLATKFCTDHGLNVGVNIEGDLHASALEIDVREFLFQATRELLFNVIKHAGTDRARIIAREPDAQTIEVVVEDEGHGCEVPTAAGESAAAKGFGLFSIQRRVEYLGGAFEFRGQPGQGCRAAIRLPKCLPPQQRFAASG